MITPSPMVLGPEISRRVREALDQQPWQETRPGVFEREVGYQGVRYRQKRWECQTCHKEETLACMLRDDLWQQVAPKNGIMCLPCIENALGRYLTPEDLKEGFEAPDLRYLLETRNPNR